MPSEASYSAASNDLPANIALIDRFVYEHDDLPICRLAESFGLNRRTILLTLRGKVTPVKPEVVCKIHKLASAIRQEPSELLNRFNVGLDLRTLDAIQKDQRFNPLASAMDVSHSWECAAAFAVGWRTFSVALKQNHEEALSLLPDVLYLAQRYAPQKTLVQFLEGKLLPQLATLTESGVRCPPECLTKARVQLACILNEGSDYHGGGVGFKLLPQLLDDSSTNDLHRASLLRNYSLWLLRYRKDEDGAHEKVQEALAAAPLNERNIACCASAATEIYLASGENRDRDGAWEAIGQWYYTARRLLSAQNEFINEMVPYSHRWGNFMYGVIARTLTGADRYVESGECAEDYARLDNCWNGTQELTHCPSPEMLAELPPQLSSFLGRCIKAPLESARLPAIRKLYDYLN